MKSIIVKQKQDGRRLDKVIREAFPNMPASALFKAFRKKDVKLNGRRVKEDHVVYDGDLVEVFITDDILEGVPRTKAPPDASDPGISTRGFSVVYEDNNLLILNKDQGIPVHPDRDQSANTLVDLATEYLTLKGEHNPGTGSFQPALCHRLDRNTGGLIILAKNPVSLQFIIDKMKSHEIKKTYRCLVQGKMSKESALLTHFLHKDERKSRVFIRDTPSGDSQQVITKYKVLEYYSGMNISQLEVELVTGRTHQIRAHMAFLGHPVIGDGKYGTNGVNRPLGAKMQELWACKLTFNFPPKGLLGYLSGRTFEIQPSFKVKPI